MCEKSRIYTSGATKRKNKAEITKTVSKLPKDTNFFAAKVQTSEIDITAESDDNTSSANEEQIMESRGKYLTHAS